MYAFIKVTHANHMKGQTMLQELLQETVVPDTTWHPNNLEAAMSQFVT